MFDQIRPLLRIAVALEDIAAALIYFATKDAASSGRLFRPRAPKLFKDRSELQHTDPTTVLKLRKEEQDLISNRGFAYLDHVESQDE